MAPRGYPALGDAPVTRHYEGQGLIPTTTRTSARSWLSGNDILRRMRVGFVGAGRMGRPMVDRLVAAGHEVAVLGRTSAARDALGAAGARPVAEAAAVAKMADVVCVCVFSDEQVREVCLLDGLASAVPPGGVLVIHTTGSPRTAQAIAARGVDVID